MADTSKESIGAKLLNLRKQAGYTQKYVAQMLGVSMTVVGNWERGLTIPTYEICVKLAEFYDISVETLIKGTAVTREPKTPKKPRKNLAPKVPKKPISRIDHWISLFTAIMELGIPLRFDGKEFSIYAGADCHKELDTLCTILNQDIKFNKIHIDPYGSVFRFNLNSQTTLRMNKILRDWQTMMANTWAARPIKKE